MLQLTRNVAGNPLKALHAFHRLRARAGREKLMILNEDYYIAMQACTELGNAEASLAVLRMLCESDIDVKPSFRAFRSFIRACATAGDAKPLLRALDDLERWGCSREESLDLLDKALNDLRVPAPACVIELVAAKARASLPLGEWVHDLITNGFTSARVSPNTNPRPATLSAAAAVGGRQRDGPCPSGVMWCAE